MSGYVSLADRIEQALARGRSMEWILAHLPVSTSDIDKALRRMDAAVADDPHVIGVGQ